MLGRWHSIGDLSGVGIVEATDASALAKLTSNPANEPWLPPYEEEKRANAFAAMFLASASAISRSLANSSESEVSSLAKKVGFGFSALVEHLYNLDLIGEAERERLRPGS